MEAYNKIGLHVGPGGNPTGIGEWMRKLDAAGIPFFLKSADNYGPLFEGAGYARASGVPHSLVYRLSTAGQGYEYEYDVPPYQFPPVEAAAIHWARTIAKLPPEFDKNLVWVEPINEIDKGRSDWLGHFAAEIGLLAMSQGYKATLFGWSSGEPEAEHWQTPGMRRYLAMCAQHPDRLAVSLHEYSYTVDDIRHEFPYKVGRFQALFDACDEMGIGRPTVHITEWGWTHEEVPEPSKALADIEDIAGVYAQHPEIKGAGLWYLGAAFGGIANLAQKLIEPVTNFTLTKRYQVVPAEPGQPPVTPPPSPPPAGRGAPRVQYSRVYVLLAPGMTAEWAHAAVAATWDDERYTIGGSADDAGIGDLDSATVIAVNPAAWGGGEDGTGLAGFYETYYAHVAYVPLTAVSPAQLEQKLRDYINPPAPPAPPPAAFVAAAWPTVSKGITQAFGVNQQNYAQFGLPGHEGIDLVSPIGTPYFAIAPGKVVKVSDRRSDGSPSAYGWHVIVDHQNGFTSLYGHAQPNPGVTPGQTVAAGDVLAHSGNTGNSSGPHLHLTLKKAGYVAPGWASSPGYIDPWPFLEEVYNRVDPPRPPLAAGFGYAQYLVPAGSDLLKATASLNVRQQPSPAAPLIGTLRTGSIARPTGATQNNYRPVEVSIYDLTNYNPSPPLGNVEIGLHTGAGGYSPPEEIAEFAGLKPGCIKTMSHHDPAGVAALAAAHPAASWIVRVYLSMAGRNVSPQQFLDDTLGDVRRTLDLLAGKRVVIELHNEPNLRSEGLDASWNDGVDFNTWYLSALARYRQALPGRSFIFPGLSPGFSFEQDGERRQEHVSFWQQCRTAVAASDGLGIHLYWSKDWPMATTLGQLDQCRAMFPGKALYVTEASNNRGGRTPAEKAAEYVAFHRELRQRPEVQAVTFFIAHPGGRADLWGWQGSGSCESWAGQGIGRLVRERLD